MTVWGARGLRQREARRSVDLDARMRGDAGWSDITIRNVSSRGFMAQCASPPRRGNYVEVRRGGVSLVGYVVWSCGSRFGVRSQAAIDIPALVAMRPGPSAAPDAERRKAPRAPVAATVRPQDQAERARQLGRRLEFLCLAIAALSAAIIIGSAVVMALGAPFEAVRAARTN